jgi:hypothetical protein
MKKKHKYLNPIILYLCVFIFGLVILGFSMTVVKWSHAYLNHLFPKIFPVYNKIYEPQAYERLEETKKVISLFLSLFLINFIALKIDNRKYERMVSLTEGQYLIKDGIKLYFKEFFTSDVIVSAVVPTVLVIPAYILSEDALG